MTLSIQKANFWKRISAWLFDTIITVMLAVGVAALLSFAVGYSKYNNELDGIIQQYQTELQPKIEEQYGVDLDVTQEEYDKLTSDQKTEYDEAAQALTDAMNKALSSNAEAMKLYKTTSSLILVIVSLSILLGIAVVQFIVPLFFHNGQTLGKKIFGVAVVRTNCVQISNFVLFVRSIFGAYTIETMFPIALIIMVYFGYMGGVGLITAGLVMLLQAGVLIGTKNNSAIHDALSDTVVVDIGSQRIFKNEEELLTFKEQQHAEEVARQDDPVYGSACGRPVSQPLFGQKEALPAAKSPTETPPVNEEEN